jgi:hypothetical protein
MKTFLSCVAVLLVCGCLPQGEKPEMTLAAMMAQRPQTTTIRPVCKLWGHSGDFYEVQIQEMNPWGWEVVKVEKESEGGRKLFEKLKDGHERPLMLRMRLVEDGKFTVEDVLE